MSDPVARLADRWRSLHRGSRIWLVGAAALLALRLISGSFDTGCFGALVAVVWYGWLGAGAMAGLWWLWRRLTYRVSVRLVLTHALAGIVPLAMTLAFLVLVSYMFVGQYAAVRYGEVEEDVFRELGELAEDSLAALERGGLEAAWPPLVAARRAPPAPLPSLEWRLTTPGGEVRESTGGLPLPAGDGPQSFRGTALGERGAYFAALEQSDAGVAFVLVPVTQELARRISDESVFGVRFALTDVEETGDGGINVTAVPSGEAGSPGAIEHPGDWEEGWTRLLEGEGSLLGRLNVLWFRLADEPLRVTGTPGPHDRRILAVLKMSLHDVPSDLFRTVETQALFAGVVGVLFVVFAGLSLLAVGLAGAIIVAITRSTGRLTRGASAIESGELDHRIPVRRHDELGDLAGAFNSMADSVGRMLAEVAEKERMGREIELAREIQRSLLPEPGLEHGPFVVRSCFRPATEVGGDYFDLVPLPGERLVVVAGDVGGHGLHTGLVMASLKSAVTTLVGEGLRGVEVATRVNAQLRRQAGGRRQIATLALVELDPAAGEASLVSAAHPPAILVAPGEAPLEIEVSSLPLGHAWPDPPGERRFAMPPGSRLVLYSDGLVEAPSATDEPFGYRRLRAEIEAGRELGPEALVERLLAAVEAHAGERASDDDLTIVVIDRDRR